ncbi:endonuclease Q family protein [Paenibacillus silvae]|uniref:endonuclease Q family protein n=1 Tax=Paenibacillus silvae TaxID=1325358 RepID=UPI002004137F|nr:endonuclease Q family protein [Paenibacillus silvae]MCK6077300.1 endonuclease Q family protein [Paenibacillus silvae]MCK6151586.1 endonuclease Q family protein [Paenibacillus silvae]MCK6269986.1 endonuclease Q family protein [Paenibacillus silvae]
MAKDTGTTALWQPCYADLHIHIGRTSRGEAVKISGSRDLTFENIAREAAHRKGIQLLGVIDCHSPVVQRDIDELLENGTMAEIEGGGIAYQDTTILLGTEIELREPQMREFHMLAYFRDLSTMKSFTAWMTQYMKNVNLSSQRVYVPAKEMQAEIKARGGLIVPAHVFTPHKGIYGSTAPRMEEVLDTRLVDAIELGLSSDSSMASYIRELDQVPFLTNSDAHSLGKIGREYNELQLANASFDEFAKALQGKEGRRIAANYGLNPRLGKYHRTYCAACGSVMDEKDLSAERCPLCGSRKLVQGVLDRIVAIADRDQPELPPGRPPYHYQVPLEFIPGLGKAKLRQLLDRFGTEMAVLHRTDEGQLAEVVGPVLAELIVAAREGKLVLSSGGGGTYGKVATDVQRN